MSRDSNEVSGEIKELQATVRGLTEELVEQNERIRQLEAALEASTEEADPSTAADESDTETTPSTEETENTNHEFDDIIVA